MATEEFKAIKEQVKSILFNHINPDTILPKEISIEDLAYLRETPECRSLSTFYDDTGTRINRNNTRSLDVFNSILPINIF
jgi:hypothetical protein